MNKIDDVLDKLHQIEDTLNDLYGRIAVIDRNLKKLQTNEKKNSEVLDF